MTKEYTIHFDNHGWKVGQFYLKIPDDATLQLIPGDDETGEITHIDVTIGKNIFSLGFETYHVEVRK